MVCMVSQNIKFLLNKLIDCFNRSVLSIFIRLTLVLNRCINIYANICKLKIEI